MSRWNLRRELESMKGGIYVRVNDHYPVENPESETATREVVGMVEKNFEESIRRAERIIDHIMSLSEI